MSKRIFLWVLTVLFLGAFGGCSPIEKHDALIAKDEACNAAWADVQANLQRRSDMIPNLVQVVKGYAAHEKDTFTAVTEARAKATAINITAADLENPEKLAEFQAAQSELSRSLGKLMAIQEAHPTLKADQVFTNLQAQIEGTENRILRARTLYNDAVRAFNLELNRFSGKVFNKATGQEFKAKAYYQADASAQSAPTVTF